MCHGLVGISFLLCRRAFSRPANPLTIGEPGDSRWSIVTDLQDWPETVYENTWKTWNVKHAAPCTATRNCKQIKQHHCGAKTRAKRTKQCDKHTQRTAIKQSSSPSFLRRSNCFEIENRNPPTPYADKIRALILMRIQSAKGKEC